MKACTGKTLIDTTVLIVDNHPIFRKGLRSLLEGSEDLHVIAEVSDGQTARASVEEHYPQATSLVDPLIPRELQTLQC